MNPYNSTDPYGTMGAMSDSELTQNSQLSEGLADRRILVMGMPRSGKTCIMQLIFEDKNPYALMDQLIPPTMVRTAYDMISGITVYDFPGIEDLAEVGGPDPSIFMGENTSLVYVIDAQNEAGKSLTELMALIRVALAANPQLPVHVFIHKIDGLSEELKMETQQGIQQRVLKNMGFENLDSSNVQFFLTTIFSEAIREALSRVSLRMVPRCDHLESILNSFCSKSSLDKVFLLDVRSKIYLATDSSPTDPQLYQFACKTIDTIGDISLLCAGLGPEREDEVVMQRTVVTMDTNMRLFMYQVNLDLSLLCLGPSAVVKQQSLLEFNAAKVAKAIRQILQ